MKNLYITYLLWILFVQLIFPQTERPDTTVIEIPDTVGVGGVDWFAYPYIFYSPETSLAFGGCRIYFDINQAF